MSIASKIRVVYVTSSKFKKRKRTIFSYRNALLREWRASR